MRDLPFHYQMIAVNSAPPTFSSSFCFVLVKGDGGEQHGRDCGQSLPPEVQPRVRQPPQRVRISGLGLQYQHHGGKCGGIGEAATPTTNIFFYAFIAQIEAGLRVSEYEAAAFAEASQFNATNFSADTKRQLFYVGSQSLSEEEMKNLSSLISEMGSIYGQVQICRMRKLTLSRWR